jgi:retinoblastoma-like protein 1
MQSKFETLASPTKTMTSMLTLPLSPMSPARHNFIMSNPKILQMTPVTSAMTTAKWLREVISPLPDKPSPHLEHCLSLPDNKNLTNDLMCRAHIILEAIFHNSNSFDISWAKERKLEASKLYYRVLESICRSELNLLKSRNENNNNGGTNNLAQLLSNERFHRCMLACSAELVLATHKTVLMMFPAVLEATGLTPFDLSKVIEGFVRHEETLPRELKRHLNSLEEQLLESMVWAKGSSLYNSLFVARPDLGPEISRLGLLAEPMKSLDDIAAQHNIPDTGVLPVTNRKRDVTPGILINDHLK